MYIYQRKKWPNFSWDQKKIMSMQISLRQQQGRLIGRMESMGFQLREEAVLEALTKDVVKSSEIEGEILDQTLVRSSVARHLGMEIAGLDVIDENVEGVVEMVLDATQKFNHPLTQERLFDWHRKLFPSEHSGFARIKVGAWRVGPVEVVSGPIGREVIHFEAPPAERIEHEMELFLDWFNKETEIDLIVKSALAHLWFVTIHPFDDGNGRIGRALADLLLARSEQSPHRFYSLSSQIQVKRKEYYTILEKTQKADLNVTAWTEWFLGCLGRAIEKALTTVDTVLKKAQFWESLVGISLNERQLKMINRLLERFEGKLTTSKWAKMTKCSQDTAYRDILDLIDRGILVKNPEGGRSTSYSLVIPKNGSIRPLRDIPRKT